MKWKYKKKNVFDDVTLIKVMPLQKFAHAYRRQLRNIILIGVVSREIFKGDDNAAAAAAV